MVRPNLLFGDVRVDHVGPIVLRRRLDSLGVIVIVIIIIITSEALCA